jgi:hypothetical protein
MRRIKKMEDDAWAYSVKHRRLLRRAHADSRWGRVRTLSDRELERQALGRKTARTQT